IRTLVKKVTLDLTQSGQTQYTIVSDTQTAPSTPAAAVAAGTVTTGGASSAAVESGLWTRGNPASPGTNAPIARNRPLAAFDARVVPDHLRWSADHQGGAGGRHVLRSAVRGLHPERKR